MLPDSDAFPHGLGSCFGELLTIPAAALGRTYITDISLFEALQLHQKTDPPLKASRLSKSFLKYTAVEVLGGLVVLALLYQNTTLCAFVS